MTGQLSVTIIEAKNLHDEDTVGGSNDAYVEVYLDDDYKQRTTTINNSNNPQWNETFQFRLERGQKRLHIKVYDDDGIAGRDAIGSAKIDLDSVIERGYFDEWVKLPVMLGFGSNGEVHILMKYQA